jgi:serine/threonine-protein kinase
MRLTKIGRYEVIRELGQGGMATVFHARDPRFKRDVAVKVLPKEFLHTKHLKARFERESQTIASLEHQAIVPVYDAGTHEGQPYLVMRFMAGGSLAARLSRGPLTIQEAAHVLYRIGSALDFAHSEGVIHRDLKPANVLFDRFGEAYLSDFGIAMLEEATLSLTKTGSIIGTPAYMSPEQVQGEDRLDSASDVYALGIILFEMLTGQQPFIADTPTKLMMKHVLEPVPRIRDVDPRLPPGADDVIARAMAKDRRERYGTAGQLAEAARELLGADRRGPSAPLQPLIEPPRARPARPRMSRTLLPEGVYRSRLWELVSQGPRAKAVTAALVATALLSGGILVVGAFNGPGASNVPTPTLAVVSPPSASRTLPPTLPSPSATPTTSPTQTPTVTPDPITPTPSFVWVTISQNARCRFGPGRNNPTVTFLAAGEIVRAYGQDPEGEWWWVELPDGSAFCWVSSAIVGQPVPPPPVEAGVTTSPPEATIPAPSPTAQP